MISCGPIDLIANVVLMLAYFLVPLSARSTRKKAIIDLKGSGLGRGGWSEWYLSPRASLMYRSRHLWSKNQKKVEGEFGDSLKR